MSRKILFILIISIIVSINLTGVWGNTEDSLTISLKDKLIPLETTKAENGFEDLMPLKEILKDKKIIGIGEATHGTAEFFEMKHRIFEFLVKEMNYKIFGIEAEFGSSKIINDYILGEGGNIGRCLESMKVWTWDTKEVSDMIIWMKEYNESVEDDDKIRFYGFDMQAIDNSLLYVFDYLSRVGVDSFEHYTRNLKEFWIGNIDPIKIGKTEKFTEDVDRIHSDITKNKNEYIENSSNEEYDLILHHLEVIYQYLDFVKDSNPIRGFNKSDYYKAKNINWILDHENKYHGNDKIMLWAHNTHISNENNLYTAMGNNLKKINGDNYYSIGFDFYQGDFVAMTSPIYAIIGGGKLSKIHIDSTPKGSFAYEMMKTDIPISFLDFKEAKEDKILLDFLSKKTHVNGIGAVYAGKPHNIGPFNEVILEDTFDGMIFIKSTTAGVRYRKGTKLPDGNKSIILNYVSQIILVIVGFLSILISTIKVSKNSKEKRQVKYHILSKDAEDSVDNKGLKGLIIKANNYFNSIPTFKYLILIILTLTSLNITFNKINSVDTYYIFRYSNIISFVVNLMYLILIELIKVYLFFILPLKILKEKFGSKFTRLSIIIIAAIIGSIISTLGYRHLGIGLYYFSILLTFINALIYCYSYELFYYREETPIYNFIIILTIYNVLMILLQNI